jgi:hypothetical protein
MKRIMLLSFILGFTACIVKLHAQSAGDSTQYLLSEKTVISGIGGPFIDFSSVNNEFAVCLGGAAAMLVNHSLFIGGYFEGIMTNHYRPDLKTIVDAEKPKIALEHGGIWLGYVYKHQKAIHGGLSMKLGWGEIDLKDGESGNPSSDYDYRDRIFAIIPQAEMELNLTQWFKVNVGLGYRIVTGIDATYPDGEGNLVDFYDKGDFNSPVGTITLVFGGHKKTNN